MMFIYNKIWCKSMTEDYTSETVALVGINSTNTMQLFFFLLNMKIDLLS